MDRSSNDTREERRALIKSRRAADERLIEAIFGDVLIGQVVAGVAYAETGAANDLAASTSQLAYAVKAI
jgi:hypothetical protein